MTADPGLGTENYFLPSRPPPSLATTLQISNFVSKNSQSKESNSLPVRFNKQTLLTLPKFDKLLMYTGEFQN